MTYGQTTWLYSCPFPDQNPQQLCHPTSASLPSRHTFPLPYSRLKMDCLCPTRPTRAATVATLVETSVVGNPPHSHDTSTLNYTAPPNHPSTADPFPSPSPALLASSAKTIPRGRTTVRGLDFSKVEDDRRCWRHERVSGEACR